jgi:hypothetical protein
VEKLKPPKTRTNPLSGWPYWWLIAAILCICLSLGIKGVNNTIWFYTSGLNILSALFTFLAITFLIVFLFKMVGLKKIFNTLLIEIDKASEEKEYIKNTERAVDSVIPYVNSVCRTIGLRRLDLAEKASLMLDKGTICATFGILFYLFSIVIWQIYLVYSEKGIAAEHIAGMVSCTIIFLFIESLSAWFMIQHQRFINTSTHLGKVAYIFDKNILAFLALEKLVDHKEKISSEHIAKILEVLGQDITWPDGILYNEKDISFDKEVKESMLATLKKITTL